MTHPLGFNAGSSAPPPATLVSATGYVSGATSKAIPFTGAVAGDFAVILIDYGAAATPVGWTLFASATWQSHGYEARVFTKVLTAGDITTGSVTFTGLTGESSMKATFWRGATFLRLAQSFEGAGAVSALGFTKSPDHLGVISEITSRAPASAPTTPATFTNRIANFASSNFMSRLDTSSAYVSGAAVPYTMSTAFGSMGWLLELVTSVTANAVDYLFAGGGGGGAGADGGGAGGGGSGGGVQRGAFIPAIGASLAVTIGLGGAAGVSGNPTTVAGLGTALGGGRGGNNTLAPASGGSGGGAGQSQSNGGAGAAGQGHNGGNQGGGGGGAGGNGGTGNGTTANGPGGPGVIYLGNPALTLIAQVFGSGGGCGGYSYTDGELTFDAGGGGFGAGAGGGGVGLANRGGGGGGGTWADFVNGAGGAGGSGVAIFSYPTGLYTCTGGTITTSGGRTIHTFTADGVFARTA